MQKKTAVAGSAGFLVIAPGVGGRADALVADRPAGVAVPTPVRVLGSVVTAAGAVTLIGSFAQFAVEGQGTPAQPAPTERL